MHAQEELLAGVVRHVSSKQWGGDMRAEPVAETPVPNTIEQETVEDYDRSMSPDLIDSRRLPYDDRQLEVIAEEEDQMALVRGHQFGYECIR